MGWFGGGLGLTWQVYVIQMLLNSFILSQKHILGVKKVVWCGLGWFGGGLGCFGVVWGVSTDRISYSRSARLLRQHRGDM